MKRLQFIDVAKGIGILLVVLGHLETTDFLRRWIYSFHMPFFFFISGFLSKLISINYITYLNKQLSRLIIPYFFFGIISIVYMLLLKIILQNPLTAKHLDDILRLFYLDGRPLPMNKVIWFLMVMFWVEMLNLLLQKIPRRVPLAALSFFGGGIISWLTHKYNFRLPFGLDIALMAYSFFVLGQLAKEKGVLNYAWNKVGIIMVFVSLLVSLAMVYITNINIDMMNVEYGNPLIFFFTAMVGTLFIFMLSILIEKNSILEYLGRNSIIILGLHGIIIRSINTLEEVAEFQLPILIFFVLVVFLVIPFILLINRCCPGAVGHKR